jgi:hypothetical protein
MAALTVATDRAAAREAATAGPASVRSAGPAAADRSGAGVRADRAVRSWPLLVLAAPAAAEVWSGWVGIAQKTGFSLVGPLPGIWPALHLDTAITLPIGVEAYAAYALRAWLARDPAISARTRRFAKWSAICSFALGMAGQVAYHLMAQAGMTRAPWGHHHRRVLPAGPGPGNGDRAGAHAARRRRSHQCTGQPDQTTSQPAVPNLVSRGPGQARPPATGDGPGPVPEPGSEWREAGPTARPWSHWTWFPGRPATGGSGPHGRPQACRGGEARVAASVALRRSQGLERGAERPGPHDQQRDDRYSASACSGWLTQPASSRTVVACLPRSAERATPRITQARGVM